MKNAQLIALGICFGIILAVIVIDLKTEKKVEYEKSKPILTEDELYEYATKELPEKRDPYIQPNVETRKGYYKVYNRTKRRDRELDRYIEHYIEENHEEIMDKYLSR